MHTDVATDAIGNSTENLIEEPSNERFFPAAVIETDSPFTSFGATKFALKLSAQIEIFISTSSANPEDSPSYLQLTVQLNPSVTGKSALFTDEHEHKTVAKTTVIAAIFLKQSPINQIEGTPCKDC